MLKMGNMKRILIFLMLLVSISLSAQDVAVKTNLLYDATTTINLGAEIGVATKWTVDLSANYNGWTFNDNKKWKHWMAQPEVRYWFCERFNGHFLGAHLLGGQYNWGGLDLPLGIRYRNTLDSMGSAFETEPSKNAFALDGIGNLLISAKLRCVRIDNFGFPAF